MVQSLMNILILKMSSRRKEFSSMIQDESCDKDFLFFFKARPGLVWLLVRHGLDIAEGSQGTITMAF